MSVGYCQTKNRPLVLGGLPYTNECNLSLFLSLYIPNQDNISLFPEVLFSDNFLPRLLKSFFGIERSRQYDIGSYIRYEPLYIISCFHYSKVQTEETGKCSHPHLHRWGFLARLKYKLSVYLLSIKRERNY